METTTPSSATCLMAEIVETTFVVSRFSDIPQKNLVHIGTQKTNQERPSFSVGSDNTRPGTTRNDQKRTN